MSLSKKSTPTTSGSRDQLSSVAFFGRTMAGIPADARP
jgi:hypothetical protein